MFAVNGPTINVYRHMVKIIAVLEIVINEDFKHLKYTQIKNLGLGVVAYCNVNILEEEAWQ